MKKQSKIIAVLLSAALSLHSAPILAADEGTFQIMPEAHQPSPTSFTGKVKEDELLVCAAHLVDNIRRSEVGQPANSPVITDYVVEYKVSIEDAADLTAACNVFDMGAVFATVLNTPIEAKEAPKAPSRFEPDDFGIVETTQTF
jgi:hypothetical protein